jgi:serine/threonine-protein kinase
MTIGDHGVDSSVEQLGAAMTPERWQAITRLYESALERDPRARDAFLADACGSDAELRREVDSLLAHEATPVVVDASVWELVGDLFDVEAGLAVGTHVGHYRIDALLGAGGMGQVYRAHDTQLQRDVALKVLPDALAGDADLLNRFRQEAQILASLNHPGIAAIYGFEDLGRVHALALELVEGPTLADRIGHGPIPVDESLAIVGQIAVALMAAHQRGVIHRDLKPANVKVTAEGVVKLLDFGLAKVSASATPLSDDDRVVPIWREEPGSSTSTEMGSVFGTPAYMSPEQIKGAELDRRTDLWALGCVLYEMLTARRAFAGADAAATLTAVVKHQPDWSVLRTDVPERIRTLLARCLSKDRQHRVADAAIVVYVLADAAPASIGADVAASNGGGRTRTAMAAAVVMLAATVIALSGWIWLSRPTAGAPAVTRLMLPTAGPEALALHGINRDLDISPNGDAVVYRAGTATEWHLTVQSLDQLEPRPLPDTARGNAPFFSPDGSWIGFSGGAQLWKTPVAGGSVTPLCRIVGASLRGASWGPDKAIYFGDSDPLVGLLSVPEHGGTPQPLTTPDASRRERDHWFPHALPNGRGIIFTIAGERPDAARVAVLDLRSGVYRELMPGSDGRYVDTGHIVYVAAGGLRVVRFDPETLAVKGDPVPLPDQAVTLASGVGNFAISRSGTLLHVTTSRGVSPWPARSLVWVDRQGREEPIVAGARAYASPRLSRDGTRLALEVRDGEPSVWIWDLRRKLLERLNSEPFVERNPVWTSDGRLLIASDRTGVANIYRHSVDGSGRSELIILSGQGHYPGAISWRTPRIFLTQLSPLADILMLDEPDGRAALLVARANSPAISPDEQWLAYQTPFSASLTTPRQTEVFVQRLPIMDGRRLRISTDGGSRPAWSRSGSELFYFDRENRLTAAQVQTVGSELTIVRSHTLLPPAYFVDAGPAPGRPYDIADDGRFLMIKEDGASALASRTRVIVVQNWTNELERLVPHK